MTRVYAFMAADKVGKSSSLSFYYYYYYLNTHVKVARI